MSETFPRTADDRFRWWALGVGTLVAASLAVYVARHGVGALPALGAVSTSVFFSKLLISQGVIEGHPFSPWSLALISWELDAAVSCLLLLWVARIEQLPIAGPALRQARTKAADALRRYPGLRRLSVSGIGLFVFLPLPGSGCVSGTLIGQIVGLSRTAGFLVVAIGAGLASASYAAVTVYLGSQWGELLRSPRTLIASGLGLLLFFWLAWRYVKRVLSQA